MKPYHQLLHGNAKASDSILLAPGSNPFTSSFRSLAHSHFFNAYISLVAILCEALIVALANVPFKLGTAFKAYIAATDSRHLTRDAYWNCMHTLQKENTRHDETA